MRIAVLSVFILVTGCAFSPRDRAIHGALIGGGTGVVAGAVAGGGTGALVAGPVGALGGAAIGAITAPKSHQTMSSNGRYP